MEKYTVYSLKNIILPEIQTRISRNRFPKRPFRLFIRTRHSPVVNYKTFSENAPTENEIERTMQRYALFFFFTCLIYKIDFWFISL